MSVRLLIDARKLGHGGIGTYLENLIDGLLELRRAGEIDLLPFLFVDPAEHRRADTPLPRWRKELYWIEEPYRGYSLREYLLFGFWHKKLLGTIDLFHSPHYTLPFSLGLHNLGSRFLGSFFPAVPCVATVHDGIHLSHPEGLLHRIFAKPLIRSTIRRATRTITVSEKSRRELDKYFHPALPLTVIPNSVSSASVSGGQQEGDRAQILFIGSDRPHKGGLNALKMLKLIKESSSEACPKLVMIGSRYASEFKKKIVSMDLVDDVEFSGYLNNDLLEQRYQTADALLVASTVEGFSIPALEALNRGIPLISTPLPSVREFAGEAAWWSADFNAESLRDAFFEMSESQSEKMRRVMEGRLLAKRFTPVSQARQTCAVYQEALNEKAQLDRDKNRSDRSAKLLWRSVLAQKQAAAGGRL